MPPIFATENDFNDDGQPAPIAEGTSSFAKMRRPAKAALIANGVPSRW